MKIKNVKKARTHFIWLRVRLGRAAQLHARDVDGAQQCCHVVGVGLFGHLLYDASQHLVPEVRVGVPRP